VALRLLRLQAVNSFSQIPVAVFMTSFEAGGTEKQMTELIRRLDQRKFKVHAVCFRRTGTYLPRVLERAASVVEFPVNGFARLETLRQMMRFARWCRRERIAIVQTCDFYSNVFGMPGAFLGGVGVRIGSRRELNPDKSPAQIRLQRLAYRFATQIVANSPSASRILFDEGVPKPRVTVIPNGLDGTAHADRIVTGPIRRVVTVANLRPEKNHETLIVAASLLARSCPGLRYRIVGDGSRRSDLEALARMEGVDQIVEFTGHRDDIPGVLADSDLFVLPSRSEAFPNGVIEAMASGLPVVASAVGGLRDLIDPGRTGILVPPGDPQLLATALQGLYDDAERAWEIGAAARADVLARYSFERMVSAFEDLYEVKLREHAVARPQEARAGV
jgi:glycosyltransferase involved in cell wall biosynthesis